MDTRAKSELSYKYRKIFYHPFKIVVTAAQISISCAQKTSSQRFFRLHQNINKVQLVLPRLEIRRKKLSGKKLHIFFQNVGKLEHNDKWNTANELLRGY